MEDRELYLIHLELGQGKEQESLGYLNTYATTARLCGRGQPFPMYKGPWGGKYILHSPGAAPMERASGTHPSVGETRTGKKPSLP